MNTQETDRPPEDLAGQKSPPAKPTIRTTASFPWFGRVRWLAIAGGVLAGLLAFAAGEATYQIIPIENEARDLMGTKVFQPSVATRSAGLTKNGALTFGLLGLCLGGCLGLAGGLARRSNSGAIVGTLLGAILGPALGAGVSWLGLPWFINERLLHAEYDLILGLGMHGLIWGSVGAAAGLAFAVGLGRPRFYLPSVIAGLLGALLGTVAFDLFGAAAFPMAECDEPISVTRVTRLLARLLVAVGTALSLALLLPDPQGEARSDQGAATTSSPDES
jgi:hypothetical protein